MACGGGWTPGPAAELFDLRVSQGLWEGSCSPGWGLPEKEARRPWRGWESQGGGGRGGGDGKAGKQYKGQAGLEL